MQKLAPPDRETLETWWRISEDPAAFLREFGTVSDPLLGVVPLTLWPHLEGLLDIWQHNRLVVVLKARQLGVSWLMAGYALWVAKMKPGANVLMLSKRQDEATALLAKAKLIEVNLPADLQFEVGKSNDSALTFPGIGSRITALPSTQDAGRGEAATLVLLDEYAFHEYAEQNFAAIKPTIDAGGQLIAVSTANGLGGAFHRLWRDAGGQHAPLEDLGPWRARQPGPNGFLPVFIPWSVRPGRDADWYARQQAEYPPHLLAQEYPRSASQAFIVSGRTVFDQDALTEVFREARQPVALPGPLEHLKRDLTVYVLPDIKHSYLIGADVAQGLAEGHGDASAATVLDARTHQEVAHYHGRMPPDTFAEGLHVLASTYPGILAVERNNHGWAVLARLRQLIGHGARYLLYQEVPPLQTPTNGYEPLRSLQPGWNTTSASKPLMISELEEAVRKGLLHLSTPALLDELRPYRQLDNGDTSAPQGEHDDRVIALAIAWQMRKWVRTQQRRGPLIATGLRG